MVVFWFLSKELFTTEQAVCDVTTHPYMAERQLETQFVTDELLDQWKQIMVRSEELWLAIGRIYICIDMSACSTVGAGQRRSAVDLCW